MATPGSTLPVASSTSPEIEAVVIWPRAGSAANTTHRKTTPAPTPRLGIRFLT
jgi:hypothetical protein